MLPIFLIAGSLIRDCRVFFGASEYQVRRYSGGTVSVIQERLDNGKWGKATTLRRSSCAPLGMVLAEHTGCGGRVFESR